jgi:hypothetical protein
MIAHGHGPVVNDAVDGSKSAVVQNGLKPATRAEYDLFDGFMSMARDDPTARFSARSRAASMATIVRVPSSKNRTG